MKARYSRRLFRWCILRNRIDDQLFMVTFTILFYVEIHD
jgi:hypothetical protein